MNTIYYGKKYGDENDRMENYNGFVAMRGKYVLRPRLSWTGLYGKEPWPRERKLRKRI